MTTIKQPEVRVNERIRVPQVRVIGDDGQQIGVLAVKDALLLAQSKGLDLVEVSPTARPPVCRVMDYGKFKYEQNRRARKAKKKQHQMQLKEIKMRPKIEEHDYTFKIGHARGFLEGRDKVKFTVTFRGREMAHKEFGFQQVTKFITEVAPWGHPDFEPKLIGKGINAMISPLPRNKRAKHPRDTGDGSPAVPQHSNNGHATEFKSKPQPAPKAEPIAPAFNNPFAQLDEKLKA